MILLEFPFCRCLHLTYACPVCKRTPMFPRQNVQTFLLCLSGSREGGRNVFFLRIRLGCYPEFATCLIYEKCSTGTGLGPWISCEIIKRYSGKLRFTAGNVQEGFRGSLRPQQATMFDRVHAGPSSRWCLDPLAAKV